MCHRARARIHAPCHCRIFRYAPSARLEYNDSVAVPQDLAEFGRKLQLIAEHEGASSAAALKLVGAKKSLANEFKRSKGKLTMMRKLGLVAERTAEEAELCSAIPAAKVPLARLGEIYAEFTASAPLSDALDRLRGIYHGSSLLAFGTAVHEYICERDTPDEEREATYRERNLPFLIKRLAKRLRDVHPPHECQLITDAVLCAAAHPELSGVATTLGDDVAARVASSLAAIGDDPVAALEALMLRGDSSARLQDDVFVRTATSIYDVASADRDRQRALLSERSGLFAEVLEFQRQNSNETQYPDCNSSLRLSAGFVEGYQAADAVVHLPKTTLGGLLDKAADALAGAVADPTEYECPPRLYTRLKEDPVARAVPANLLYSTDTVGGNSGSPVLNAEGSFVGINFDRQRQVTRSLAHSSTSPPEFGDLCTGPCECQMVPSLLSVHLPCLFRGY